MLRTSKTIIFLSVLTLAFTTLASSAYAVDTQIKAYGSNIEAIYPFPLKPGKTIQVKLNYSGTTPTGKTIWMGQICGQTFNAQSTTSQLIVNVPVPALTGAYRNTCLVDAKVGYSEGNNLFMTKGSIKHTITTSPAAITACESISPPNQTKMCYLAVVEPGFASSLFKWKVSGCTKKSKIEENVQRSTFTKQLASNCDGELYTFGEYRDAATQKTTKFEIGIASF